MKLIKAMHMSLVQCPGLGTLQQCAHNNRKINADFSCQTDVVIIPQTVLQSSKGLG